VADLIYEKHPKEHYALLTLNRPDRLNAMDTRMFGELGAAVADFERDPQMRCAVVTGEGRAFSAGADLKEMAENNARRAEIEARYQAGDISAEQRRVELGALEYPVGAIALSGCSKPFVGAINGVCVAAGMELAMDCDIRIASSAASFGLTEVKRGIVAMHAVQNLPRVMPYGEVMYLLLTADRISAEQAHHAGFVHEVLAPDALMSRALEIAAMIARNAPIAVQAAKAVASFWRRSALEESASLSRWVSRVVLASEDAKEGPRAFAEKREPVWQGR
jgi:enoyl-CoA hydratase/carnithine racemase